MPWNELLWIPSVITRLSSRCSALSCGHTPILLAKKVRKKVNQHHDRRSISKPPSPCSVGFHIEKA